MSPARRIISLLCALALILGGAYWAVHIWLFAEAIHGKVILAPIFMICAGCFWLYYDYIEATPNERP
jgi:hypothetical protein